MRYEVFTTYSVLTFFTYLLPNISYSTIFYYIHLLCCTYIVYYIIMYTVLPRQPYWSSPALCSSFHDIDIIFLFSSSMSFSSSLHIPTDRSTQGTFLYTSGMYTGMTHAKLRPPKIPEQPQQQHLHSIYQKSIRKEKYEEKKEIKVCLFALFLNRLK